MIARLYTGQNKFAKPTVRLASLADSLDKTSGRLTPLVDSLNKTSFVDEWVVALSQFCESTRLIVDSLVLQELLALSADTLWCQILFDSTKAFWSFRSHEWSVLTYISYHLSHDCERLRLYEYAVNAMIKEGETAITEGQLDRALADFNQPDYRSKAKLVISRMKAARVVVVAVADDDDDKDDKKACVVCMDNDKKVAFVPCGHIATCESCAPSFVAAPCPICRAPVQSTMVVFNV